MHQRTGWGVALCAALLAGLLGAGCTDDAAGSDEWRLHGNFHSDRTNEDVEEFHEIASRFSSDVAIMESFPEQFTVSKLDQEACTALHAELAELDYLDVGSCVLVSSG